jgi:hypothetical protein
MLPPVILYKSYIISMRLLDDIYRVMYIEYTTWHLVTLSTMLVLV